MARSDAVWGIDIGQCGLKALRLRPHEDPSMVVADAFDYIEYPKILSQPEADPAQLVKEALEQFLSRNSVRGDRVAMSVPGQAGLARFIKLPPVESKKIPDIVKYEARQQIPFALEDVVWDYQKMVGGSEEEGFALETEVGLFAMKRDQVYRSLAPFKAAGIEVDFIQLAPLALYNYIGFDQLNELPPPEEFDPENPPESVVVLSLGTDSTDLVVTNGYRVWQRSIPLGGSHFTKAITKELKLTYAAAEHLKRNAAKAEDPKALFQAMRPVFNDMLTEVQRSIGFFSNLDRSAKIGRIVGLGNAIKLPGLQRYLHQNLGLDVARVDKFRGIAGGEVVDAPAFKENVATFAVAYGLALQGIRATKIQTNLVPREIVKERLIRAKKPWAVAAAAALLLGLSVSYMGYYNAWSKVKIPDYFEQPLSQVKAVVDENNRYKSEYDAARAEYDRIAGVGKSLTPSDVNRKRWLDITSIVALAMPRDESPNPDEVKPEHLNELYIEVVTAEHVDDLATTWWTGVQQYAAKPPAAGADGAAVPGDPSAMPTDPSATPADPSAADPSAVDPAAAADATATDPAAAPLDSAGATGFGDPSLGGEEAAIPGPTGPGLVVQVIGHHFHNDKKEHGANTADEYVRRTLVENLNLEELPIPQKIRDQYQAEYKKELPETVNLKDLGLGYAVLIKHNPMFSSVPYFVEIEDTEALAKMTDPSNPQALAQPGGPMGPMGQPGSFGGEFGGAGQGMMPTRRIERYDFIVQFCVMDTPAADEVDPSTVADASGLQGAPPTPAGGVAPSGETAPVDVAAGDAAAGDAAADDVVATVDEPPSADLPPDAAATAATDVAVGAGDGVPVAEAPPDGSGGAAVDGSPTAANP